MNAVVVVNAVTGEPVGDRIGRANTLRTRLFGLLGRGGLEAGGGIWIVPSSGVHTVGMSFAIDVVGLDRGMRVVRLWPEVKPFRVPGIDLRVRSVLELAAGQIEARGIRVGDLLAVRELDSAS